MADEINQDIAIARAVGRLSGRYVLSAFQLLIELYGDIRAGLLAQAVHAANTAHVSAATAAGRASADSAGVLPDDARRPIGIARLADTAGLPFETTRRIVQRLIDAGICLRLANGVIVPESFVRRPQTLRAVHANLAHVRTFVRDLQAAGLAEQAPSGLGLSPDGDDDVFARIVGRLSADYILRALRLLVDTYGDIRAGIVAQAIVTANAAHLETEASGSSPRYAGLAENPPDAARRPISVVRLARSLGVPYETMRAQAHRLLDAGICIRVKGGLIVPAALLERPAAAEATLANVGYVRRFVRDLAGIERPPGRAVPTADLEPPNGELPGPT